MVSWSELIASRLESTKRFQGGEMEICCCPRQQGVLFYDYEKRTYIEQGSCKSDKICAILMIAKHHAFMTNQQHKKQTFRETTLDEFFF
ncbi:MAG: hypothetical protein ACE5R6_04620 [Candidatus Heimdallarchaeota archaeon]